MPLQPVIDVAVVAPDDWTIWLFYRHLIAALQRRGARVTAISAPGPSVARLREMDVEHIGVPYARFVEPWQDIRLFVALRDIFRARSFDIVQNITIKANIYGALAASASGVKSILNTVEGGGLLYSDSPTLKVRLIRRIAEIGLRRSGKSATAYWFVNERDRDLFIARGLADREKTVVAIATGVDTNQFNIDAVTPAMVSRFKSEAGIPDDVDVVTNVAGRLLNTKGIAEFIDCAREVKSKVRNVEFLLVGPLESRNPDAFSAESVQQAVNAGTVKWISFREDVSTVYASSTIAIVPSYYAEGTPKGVLEGMAMSLPVIAADIPSSRALIDDGLTGLLVEPRSGSAIAGAIVALLADPEKRRTIGNAARRKAVSQFDADSAAEIAVNNVYTRLPAWRALSQRC